MSQFRGVAEFPQFSPMAQSWREIRSEFLRVADEPRPWRQQYLHNGLWHVMPLFRALEGRLDSGRCQRTLEAVLKLPGAEIAAFSVLKPGAQLKPHTGNSPRLLRAHLTLVEARGAYIEVQGERRGWADGELFVFDDNRTHHVAHRGDTDRVVLIVDFIKA